LEHVVKFPKIILALLLAAPAFWLHGAATINSMTMTPPNAEPGDQVLISIDYCDTGDYSQQAILLAVRPAADGTTITSSCPSARQIFIAHGPAAGTCDNCGMTNAVSLPPDTSGFKLVKMPQGGGCAVATFYTTLPTLADGMLPGQQYNLIVKMNQWSVDCTTAFTDMDYLTFTTTPPQPEISVRKSAEGVASPNELVLFWLDYDMMMSTNVQLTDLIDTTYLDIVDWSPNAVVTGGNNFTFNLGDATATSSPKIRKIGRVWVLARVKSTTPPNTIITNQARIRSTQLPGGKDSNPVELQVGTGTNVSVSKGQFDVTGVNSVTQLRLGETVTYRLNFTLSGLGLKHMSSFDEMTVGATTSGAAGVYVPNTGNMWQHRSQDGNGGTWSSWAVRSDGQGGGYLQATTTQYGYLTLEDTAIQNAAGNFCEGTIITEAYMGTTQTDLGILLRSNNLPASSAGNQFRAVWLLMSKDTSFGAGCNGNLAIQINSGTNRTVNGCYDALDVPASGVWYTVKAMVTEDPVSKAYRYRAKYWVRGSDEPSAWMVDWTDTTNTGATDFGCNVGDPGMNTAFKWLPGFGNQGDDNGFDNYRVLANNSLLNARLYDSIPAGIDYRPLSAVPVAQGLPSGTGANEGMVRWDFTGSLNGAVNGRVYDASGFFEWQGVVDCTEGVTAARNTAYIDSDNPGGPYRSQETVLDLICGTPTSTVTPSDTRTPTPTRTPTATPSDTPSVTLTSTNTSTRTDTPSPTPTSTITSTATHTSTRTHTPSPTPTYTATLTATQSVTLTSTRTFTQTSTHTPSATQTHTRTITVTHTPSATQTLTATQSITFTGSPTYTATATHTPTRTITESRTSTATSTHTSTATLSRTATLTVTETPTITMTGTLIVYSATITVTRTITLTSTLTSTLTPSYTVTLTATPTISFTPTATQTLTATQSITYTSSPTYTPTATQTLTATESITYTSSPTYTPTATQTLTATESITFTGTRTATETSTETQTRTSTPTFTTTSEYTPTNTPTSTITSSATPTPSSTPSVTDTRTQTLTRTPTQTPSDTRTQTVTFTETGTRTSTITASQTPTITETRTATSTITDTRTRTETATITATMVPVPFSMDITIYNSAGEVVRRLYQGGVSLLPDGVMLDSEVLGDQEIHLLFPGKLASDGSSSLAWDGTNDNGQYLENGTYTIKIEARDQFGHVTAQVKQVSLVSPRGENEVALYNSSGEIVLRYNIAALMRDAQNIALRGSNNSRMPDLMDMSLPEGDSFAQAYDPQTGQALSALLVTFTDENGDKYSWKWDGRNQVGQRVQSGTYILALLQTRGNSQVTVVTRQVVVISTATAPASASSAILVPNPVVGADKEAWTEVVYKPALNAQAWVVVYNLAGEKVGQGGDPLKTGKVRINLDRLSGGVYLVRFTLNDGKAIFDSKMLRLAVVK
jgi:flagellar hook assembly protein FlgD